jgi:hypothetical protein
MSLSGGFVLRILRQRVGDALRRVPGFGDWVEARGLNHLIVTRTISQS